MEGLVCCIYQSKSIGNCSNHGISSKVRDVTLTGPSINGPFEPSEDAPEVTLVTRHLFGRDYTHAIPVKGKEFNQVGWMMGGCFIYTSDSRFPFDYPIPLHDRQETQELNELLSY